MCHRCNYQQILNRTGLEPTENRMRVLEVIGSNGSPLSARQIHEALQRTGAINRVTVYRILDLLTDKGIIERISGGGRAFFYGLAPNENHERHPHFYCRSCGALECLTPDSLSVDMGELYRTYPGEIEAIAVRVDGICMHCRRFAGQT